ncbi:MAG: hypothetical protein CVV63_03750, partial [Tenericutes bacterium HGW-Tenericutes-8]
MKKEHIILSKRKELGMTQQELAKILNVTDKTVSRWENGITPPSHDMIPLIIKVLNISYEVYFGSEVEDCVVSTSEKKNKSYFFILAIACVLGVGFSTFLFYFFYKDPSFSINHTIRFYRLVININNSLDLYLLQTWIHLFVLFFWSAITILHIYYRERKYVGLDLKILFIIVVWMILNYLNLIDIYSE